MQAGSLIGLAPKLANRITVFDHGDEFATKGVSVGSFFSPPEGAANDPPVLPANNRLVPGLPL
jgi:hypothetical protein